MKNKGLIVRKVDVKDRRKFQIFLTDLGRELEEPLNKIAMYMQQRHLNLSLMKNCLCLLIFWIELESKYKSYFKRLFNY